MRSGLCTCAARFPHATRGGETPLFIGKHWTRADVGAWHRERGTAGAGEGRQSSIPFSLFFCLLLLTGKKEQEGAFSFSCIEDREKDRPFFSFLSTRTQNRRAREKTGFFSLLPPHGTTETHSHRGQGRSSPIFFFSHKQETGGADRPLFLVLLPHGTAMAKKIKGLSIKKKFQRLCLLL